MVFVKHALLALGVAAFAAVIDPGSLIAQEVVLVTASAEPMDAETAAAIEAIRQATAKYQDVEIALAEGYVRDPGNLCVTAPEEGLPVQLGAMGIHYFRPDLLQITAMGPRVDGAGMHTDFTQPSVLVYVPDETGALRLAAVENLVFEKAWKAAGNAGPPEFLGRQYWHRIDNPLTADVDEAHMFEPHYELHVWLHEDNPSGMFSPYNPRVSCDTHDGPRTMAEAAAYMAAHAPPPAEQP
ncbi:MAG TPA: hypothetical protein VJP59_07595 [Gemmatimonadota bacterium]|nr:hypothetical protein [Gemmatimonadota bacterium]